MDKRDPLAHMRNSFHFPKVDGHDVVYLCGNSLGLQPRTTRAAINEELDDWACMLFPLLSLARNALNNIFFLHHQLVEFMDILQDKDHGKINILLQSQSVFLCDRQISLLITVLNHSYNQAQYR